MDWFKNCFAEVPQHVTAFVLSVITLVSTLRDDQNKKVEEVQGSIFVPKPREVAIDIPNLVSLPAHPSMKKSHRPSNNSQDAFSPNPTIEVEIDMVQTSSGSLNLSPMITHEERVEIDMPTASSPPPLVYPLPKNPHGEQTSYGVPSQSTAHAPPPIPGNDALTPPPVPIPEGEEPDLKIELKVATWVTIISAGGIVSVISGVIGNEKALLPRKLLFKDFISLNYIALVSGIGLFILIKISPNIPGFVRIVKFIMWIAIGSVVFSLGLATCIMSKAEIVLILVVPIVMVGLVGILSFARRE